MPGIACQKEPPVAGRPVPAVSEFDVASRGDEFHWDGQTLKVDLSDLECDAMLMADLSLESDRALQSTVDIKLD